MNDLQTIKDLLKSELKKCEVDFTCQYIDQVMQICKNIIDKLETNISNSNDSDLTSTIKLTIGLLSMVAIGDNCELEKLREKNDQLRSWGKNLYSLCSKIIKD
jgi:hypothetical protein